jgi:hypothetical protein
MPSQQHRLPVSPFYGPEKRVCPRCDGMMTRPLPRVSQSHAAWCECLECRHLWLPHEDQTWHQHLYGRS